MRLHDKFVEELNEEIFKEYQSLNVGNDFILKPDIYVLDKDDKRIGVECEVFVKGWQDFYEGLGQAISYFNICDKVILAIWFTKEFFESYAKGYHGLMKFCRLATVMETVLENIQLDYILKFRNDEPIYKSRWSSNYIIDKIKQNST